MNRINLAHSGRAMAARSSLIVAAAAGSTLALTSGASAWLGGFEAADGYEPFLNMVQNYNSGQYGANSGYAGAYSVITPNTGLWEALAGGFFSGSSVSYATGHQAWDRTWTNTLGAMGANSDQALVLTSGHEGWTGPALKYKYNLDASDLNGVSPASTGGSTIDFSFWVRGGLAGPEWGGEVPEGYYGNEVQFLDAAGNVGFSVGLTQRGTGDTVTYWDGSSIFESTILGATNRYDRWDISLDLATNTVSASYFQFLTSTSFPVVTGAPLMTAMGDFSSMTFRSSPGVNNSKGWAIDDFKVVRVPAPGAACALALLGLAATRRRR